MLRIFFFICLITSVVSQATAQAITDSFLTRLFQRNDDTVFQRVTDAPEKYRLQIIYTQIDRDKNNNPVFKDYYFNHDPSLYFNPASMVKMPLAFLALEKLNGLKRKGIDKYTTVQFDSTMPWQTALISDTSARSGVPTIAHLIKRAFLISENDPYNRLYQFVGQGPANSNLHKKGYRDVRITRQFLGLTEQQNRITNAVRFLGANGELLYHQPPATNTDSFDFSRPILVGKAHLNRNDSLIKRPFDFTKQNNTGLFSLKRMLQSVMFPQSFKRKERFNLSQQDYRFLRQYLSQYPSETPDPKYDTGEFYDSYVKFFFRDSSKKMPAGVRVFNKVGWSYGFLTDVSYVADFKHNVEYMLAATIYVNSDEILNDNNYEYLSIGHPFLYELGQTIYEYELSRTRQRAPDLSEFRLTYEQRDSNDVRPSLKEVDN